MGAHRAQGDDEFLGDLGSGKLGFEQAEKFQLTLAERLDQGLRSRGRLDLTFRNRDALALPCPCASNAASSLPV